MCQAGMPFCEGAEQSWIDPRSKTLSNAHPKLMSDEGNCGKRVKLRFYMKNDKHNNVKLFIYED